MKALDFINKEIEGCIKNIDFCNYKGWDSPEHNQRLIDLKEVKEQLEAWEVCKNKMELYQEQHYSLAKETTTKTSETIQIRIFVNDQNQVQTIIKALEVKDE